MCARQKRLETMESCGALLRNAEDARDKDFKGASGVSAEERMIRSND